ncbi:hypothetical protein GQ53DRAFT_750262 [Thozetella sp. PMI_491]|nr:hypothetical protein GQ53DRAFT_750262 [Thozetella sp. PMI_491]
MHVSLAPPLAKSITSRSWPHEVWRRRETRRKQASPVARIGRIKHSRERAKGR